MAVAELLVHKVSVPLVPAFGAASRLTVTVALSLPQEFPTI